MQNKRYVICGNIDYHVPEEYQNDILRFHLYGDKDENKLTLEIQKMRAELLANVSPRFEDLLNIATYVFASDQRTIRGKHQDQLFDNDWYRHFYFVIPVRDVDFWRTSEVLKCLCSTLGFLSDDIYEFEFVPMKNKPNVQEFLNINQEGEIISSLEQVIMFSGGLDSLGGAVEEIINQKHRVFLVNHRSTPKLDKRYENIERLLSEKSVRNQPYHVRVTVQKQKAMNKEYTQRSRSFLFVSLGGTIANIFKLKNVRFYENGIISLNLPVSAQVVGGRATRTTHPKVIAGFQNLLTLVSEEDFKIENPFLWKTKTDIVRDIIKSDCADLIQHSSSCAHTWEVKTTQHSHCGTCSQCIDRRFAIIAADAEAYDPITSFAVDIFTQGRDKDIHKIRDKMMFASYIGRANRVVKTKTSEEFLKIYPEVRRILSYMDDSSLFVSLDRAFDMYKKHAMDIRKVNKTLLARYAGDIADRTLPADAFLRMVYESALPKCVPVTPIIETKPNNIFRKRGDVWEIRFNGGESFIISSVDKGCEYIRELLTRPNQNIPVWEIITNDENNLVTAALGQVGDVKIDKDGLKVYHDHLTELEGELENAQKNGDYALIDEMTQEKETILKELKRVTHGGKIVDINEQKRKLSNAFSGAVKRAIKKIKETDASFAEHLTQSLQFGNTPVYNPPESIQWETDPIINT